MGLRPPPVGHRNNQFHYYDAQGVTLNEHHYTHQIQEINFVLDTDLADNPTGHGFNGTMTVGGLQISGGTLEWQLADSDVTFTARLPRERNLAFVDDISRKARMHELPDTNESLIARVKDPRDAAAWSEFLAIYRPVVYRLARSRGLQHADAEDLAQQVFMSIARVIERWEPSADMPPFRAWLYRIARNAILKAVTRKKPDQGAGSTSVEEMLQEIPDADEEVTAEFLRESRLETFRWAAAEIRNEFTNDAENHDAIVGLPMKDHVSPNGI